MSVTRMRLPYREIDPPPRGLQRLLVVGETGDPDLDGLIHVEYHGPVVGATEGGWRVTARQARDASLFDGWDWRPLMLPVIGEGEVSELVAYPSEAAVKATIAANWEVLEVQARGWLVSAPVAGLEAVEEERDRQRTEGLLGAVHVAAADADDEPLVAAETRVAEAMAPILADGYRDAVDSVVRMLRRTAEDIERLRVPTSPTGPLPAYGYHAAAILDEIRAMLGNLHLGTLTKAARDADLTARGVKP